MEKEKYSYVGGIAHGIKTLTTGLNVTLKEFFTKKTTQEYPENRATLQISDRFRGTLVMPHDENGNNKCISCLLCEMNCPNDTLHLEIETVTDEAGKKRKILRNYQFDLGSCLFCQLCVNVCPTDAICFENEFENAVFDKTKLVQKLNFNKD
ncbi:MAG: NADH-quinone oxidoreductase subunit I [Tannerella sp.]|jgi:NADH-quinone oxidoreductase subunit I|nr:NADH-quinone oxidoreductase subunit I [Tannerella sp.]